MRVSQSEVNPRRRCFMTWTILSRNGLDLQKSYQSLKKLTDIRPLSCYRNKLHLRESPLLRENLRSPSLYTIRNPSSIAQLTCPRFRSHAYGFDRFVETRS